MFKNTTVTLDLLDFDTLREREYRILIRRFAACFEYKKHKETRHARV
jgi:hypothetical protein